jgi:uncharacterized LabA/DUF88 family protein
LDRCALFVDAGYLLAAGGALCCGTTHRSEITCGYKELVAAFATFAEHQSGHPVLRVYWYDAALHAVPTIDHLRVAELPHVKLRLGRISGGKQKGVDSLIVRDFMTLARERAMVTAFLLAGDEDLREGVIAAQDMGVRVIVLGIPGLKNNQAETLIREADEHVMLAKDFLSPHFSRVIVPAIPKATVPASPASTGVKAKIAAAEVSPRESAALSAGSDFASAWAEHATPDEVKELLSQCPRIPTPLDAQLVREAEKSLGSLRENQDLKKSVRKGFWKKIKSLPSV